MDAIVLFDPISSAAYLKESVKELGYKVIGVFTKPISVFKEHYHVTEEMLFSNCDEVILAQDKEEVLRQLKSSKYSIIAAITGIDSGIVLTDQICHELSLWSNPFELSNARRDKGEMRQVLKRNGLTCPDFQLCYSEKDVLAFAEKHTFPLVIKTPHGAATSQVYMCDDIQDLLEKFQDIMTKDDFFGEHANEAVLEEYISGKEYAVNTFSDGENMYVTDIWCYEKINSESFKNIYYNVVSHPLTDPELKPLVDYAIKIVKAFRVERGPTHLEIKHDPSLGPTLIEINPRLAGARMPLFLKNHSNFDPYEKTIEVFVKGKTKIPQPIITKKHFAVALCPVFQRGKIQNISGVDSIEKLESYEDHVINIKPGDELTSTTDMLSTPFLVFLTNSDRGKLLKDLEKAHALFSVTFD